MKYATIARTLLLAALPLWMARTPRCQGPQNFESPQAHPMAISSDGARLYAVNTPAHCLSVWSIADPARPLLLREIPLGLAPISIALESDARAWVVNHVSDSISVVDLGRGIVLDTIQVEDEAGDVVFAGTPRRAFVSSMTERKVLVFDTTTRRRVAEIDVFGDDPRALLASRDGRTVWVSIARSGNGTTIVPHTIAPPPPPPTRQSLPPAPRQGILVRADDPTWEPRLGVKLPDYDVVEIDVSSLRVRRNYRGVGTSLFNIAERPGATEIWVANTHARNLVRFEPALRGHLIDTRITRIAHGASATVTPIDLNPGIDYAKLPNLDALRTALSPVTDICFAPDGQTAFAAAFGTDRVAVLDPSAKVLARIEVGNASGAQRDPRNKRGPRALVHHPRADVLYCFNRLSNSLSVLDTGRRRVVREVALFDPTPRAIREGRGFLYDAKLSGNGTASCAACHIDGKTDGLAWDLGDPGGTIFNNGVQLHPMKGPLLTQTLQGLGGERIFHWRADRPGLASFNVTFDTLMGGSQLSAADMALFVGFMQEFRFMPNPRLERDGSLRTTPRGESAKDGERIFLTKQNVGRDGQNSFSCVDCHSRASGAGSFGFDGLVGQPMKAVQLRGLYKRTGRAKVAGQQSAGFGFGADGASDDLREHLSNTRRFNPLSGAEKAALERYLLSFPSETAPIVGYSRSLDRTNIGSKSVVDDVLLMITQAKASRCDLIGKAWIDGRPVGLFYDTGRDVFVRDRATDAPLTLAELGARVATGARATLMGVPPGSGRRLGIDRDDDKVLDGDEGRARYGSASPACAPTVELDANRSPKIGAADFAVVATNTPPRSSGLLLLAATRGRLRVADLELLIDLGTSIPLPLASDARGDAIAALPIPNDRGLVDRRLVMQTIFAAGCGQLGVKASNGLELRVSREESASREEMRETREDCSSCFGNRRRIIDSPRLHRSRFERSAECLVLCLP